MHSSSLFMKALVSASLATSFVAARAQQSGDPQGDQAAQQARGGQRRGGAGAGAGGDFPTGPAAPRMAEDTRPIDEVIKDYTKVPGLVTLYRQKHGASDSIMMEIPESMMGKLMLLQVTSGSGLGDTPDAMVFHGMPLDDIPIRIRKVDDSRIEFVRPNLAHRSSLPEVKRMIERSFPDEVLASFDIRSRQPSAEAISSTWAASSRAMWLN